MVYSVPGMLHDWVWKIDEAEKGLLLVGVFLWQCMIKKTNFVGSKTRCKTGPPRKLTCHLKKGPFQKEDSLPTIIFQGIF